MDIGATFVGVTAAQYAILSQYDSIMDLILNTETVTIEGQSYVVFTELDCDDLELLGEIDLILESFEVLYFEYQKSSWILTGF